ncbi:cellobiose phosphorylase [Paenibacillus sp. HN-1]|uniref:cellobiose phosphorylase n=1 Tax=Paenibacillus TaxID=44249 RepID=UPI001CAA0002|nr:MULTISPECIES: cellobiose phosphorylase [Paenibacillus]MBY9079135.1 cellobiose phosphorylase [Paenibacillus sp. CGMCC 1.18879]MBY9086913.1 cellobiose phosphorylase [Paenibacillus sinensis]
MPAYYVENQHFVIEEFDKAKTFASFLPGLAGPRGIPMWTFYVNRGQGIASFGVRDKNSPIMEFSPASISYKNVPLSGFRTFVKLGGAVYEPFLDQGEDPSIRRTMRIGRNELVIEETNLTLNLQVKIVYFNMPGDEFAALARHVEITNQSASPMSLEVLDGLPELLPYGIDNAGYKEMGNLLRSWMEIYNLENAVPFFKLRSSTKDEAEVREIKGGHFYFAFSGEEELLPPIVDYEVVFGHNTSLVYPASFARASLEELGAMPQITANKVPCAFSGTAARLVPGESLNLYAMIGHTRDIGIIQSQTGRLCRAEYFRSKREEAARLADQITDDIATSTSSTMFDAYCRQSYLDNVLRGGYPVVFGQGPEAKIYHLFSRKHGDLERDYNFFSLAPEYYSQGNGNFRDMNQNRRNDVLFHPEAGAFNIYMFFSLIQADGYNPLQVKGSTFQVPKERAAKLVGLLEYAVGSHHRELSAIAAKPFTPGQIIHYLSDHEIMLKVSEEELLDKLLGLSMQNIEASFGEGYWIDHWTYNMDLVDSYRAVFPDKMEELLHTPGTCRFFDSPVRVLPRSEKMVLKDGKVRQYGSTVHDDEKLERLGGGMSDTRWLRTKHGTGEVYRTDLFAKMLSLALIKMTTLDPYGMGVEMEGDKPGWNDAMNGLPALFGSGMGETYELKRLVLFILEALSGMPGGADVSGNAGTKGSSTNGEGVGSEGKATSAESKEKSGSAGSIGNIGCAGSEGNVESAGDLELAGRKVRLPREMAELLSETDKVLSCRENGDISDLECWDLLATARERCRESIRFGLSGDEREIAFAALEPVFKRFLGRLNEGIAKAVKLGGGLVPTYFRFEAEEYEPLKSGDGGPVISPYGLPVVSVSRFRAEALPAFLEGPVHGLKLAESQEEAQGIYRAVRSSGLYDEKLGMYKTSVSLGEQPQEIGRIRAFTPGWLERESVFLHMSYKYVLELLKTGLTGTFYEEFKRALIPFQDPAVYGRSTLENSSFIASSVNPDPGVHGRGFVARLSGSTAEFLSMWSLMMAGSRPFRLSADGDLVLELAPALPGWLFRDDGRLSFRFLGSVNVTYINERRADTFGENRAVIRRISVKDGSGNTVNVEGGVLSGRLAEDIRAGRYTELEAVLE